MVLVHAILFLSTICTSIFFYTGVTVGATIADGGMHAAFGVLVHCRTINKLTCSVLDWAKSYHLLWQRSWPDANRDPEIRRIVQMNQPLCTHLKADEGRQRCVVVVATETDFCTWQPWAVLWLFAIGRSMASRFAPILTLSPSSTKSDAWRRKTQKWIASGHFQVDYLSLACSLVSGLCNVHLRNIRTSSSVWNLCVQIDHPTLRYDLPCSKVEDLWYGHIFIDAILGLFVYAYVAYLRKDI